MAVVALHLAIRGFVQGVGYRAWMVGLARSRGLRGWVRNRPDGSVEALVIGEEMAVAALAAACERGPRLAQVAEVRRDPAADDGSPGFAQRPTG